MEKNLEKSLKRYLKRKVKITLRFIVAFLLSCNFVWAEGIEITQGDNEEILFNGEVFNEETHQFAGNTFDKESNIYINNSILEKSNDSGDSVAVEIVKNFDEEFTFINNNYISSSTVSESGQNAGQAAGINIITEKGNISVVNNGKISTTAETFENYNASIIGVSKGISVSSMENIIDNINIENNGFINVNNGIEEYGIFVQNGNVEKIKNTGLVSVINDYKVSYNISAGIVGLYTNISEVENYGIINTKGNLATSIYSFGEIKEMVNNGLLFSYNDRNDGAYIFTFMSSNTGNITNNGLIAAKGDNIGSVINVMDKPAEEFKNNGVLYATGEDDEYATLYLMRVPNTINFGTIIKNTENDVGTGIKLSSSNGLSNYGIISADNPLDLPYDNDKVKNYGLYLSEDGKILEYVLSNKQPVTSREEEKIESADNESGKTIINAGSDLNGFAQSIKSSTIKDLKEDTGYILNSYDKTVVIDENTGSKDINNSIINAVKNAVTFDGELTLGLNNTTVNGGYGENIIQGDDNKNTLNLSGTSIINGNTDLGAGDDTLNLSDTVQINGTLDGGNGTDSLNFGISKDDNVSTFAENEKSSLNILYNITDFENTEVNTKVTLFEKTINDKGDIENLSAQLGNIVITKNGEIVLRVDGTEKDEDTGKVTGHALYKNTGSITAEEGGKLTLYTIGFGENEIVDFKETNLSNLKEEDIKLSSILHKGKIGEYNTITVSAKKDLEDLEIADYDKLNKIYHSILNSENVDKFTVEEEQFGAFVKYLHDIYAGNPYAYSSELSRKTMSMMKNLADRDLNPEFNKWAIYGGLTHTDGGTENSYYGKGYYTYDIGSRDISADTKITGAYFKAEYGKEKDLTTGIIFGGNNTETEIGASKVEGDSFYFGAYAKKYLNDFRFTLGAGFQHGDYKSDRTAVGYDGILADKSSQKYDSNYHDRGFNIYGNVKYSKELGNNFFFEPSATLEYSYVDQDGAGENGVLTIETDSKNFDYLSGTVNLDLRKIISADKFTHSFITGISYERMFSGYDEEYITGRIKGGTDFDILVPEKEKDIFSLNAKYELETEKGFIFDVKGSYRFEHDSNKDEWIFGTGIGYKF